MSEDVLSSAQRLSDQDLIARVKALARHEREVTVALIAHLAVFDDRRLYLGEGCGSLFSYCTQVLHLSEHAAYGRIETARAARRFPVILELLADGSVTITTVGLLSPHLTPANHRGLLESARHRSKRQVEDLVAQLRPLPPIPSIIRRLPLRRHRSSRAETVEATDPTTGLHPSTGAGPDDGSNGSSQSDAGRCRFPTRPDPAVVAPLGLQRYRVQFTARSETCDKLRLAQDLLRHQLPDGDLGEIVDRAVTLLIETLAKEKFAAAARPRTRLQGENGGQTSGSRHIPAEVKRTVWRRDGGRCAFVAHNGRRCNERGFLEFHHVEPFSAGGEATSDNIQLRCRAHNRYEAVLHLGGPLPATGLPCNARPAIPGGTNGMIPPARAEPG